MGFWVCFLVVNCEFGHYIIKILRLTMFLLFDWFLFLNLHTDRDWNLNFLLKISRQHLTSLQLTFGKWSLKGRNWYWTFNYTLVQNYFKTQCNLQPHLLLANMLLSVFLGWHSQPIWNEAPQEQYFWRVLPANHVSEEARHPEGSAVDRVRVWERTGLRRGGQRVVLPPV